jgi:hypothetical protein
MTFNLDDGKPGSNPLLFEPNLPLQLGGTFRIIIPSFPGVYLSRDVIIPPGGLEIIVTEC